MSVNKHYCQGTNCHTNQTQDRFQKSKTYDYGNGYNRTYKEITKINSQNS